MTGKSKNLDPIAAAWGLGGITPLLGDAGLRQYYRVLTPDGGKAILALYPAKVPGADDPFNDFISLHSYLGPILRVPAIHRSEPTLRAMLLEDVGDATLGDHLARSPQEEYLWAEKVAWELMDWVGPLTIAAPQGVFFVGRSFDMAKYGFEWAFCTEHFFNGLLGKRPPLWLDRMMARIHAYLAPRAKYLAHRDFHVRNLMVSSQRPVTIDFQDARLGPATYDLASIMFDGYWDWGKETKKLMADRLMAALGWPEAGFWGELNQVALQRGLKALGTFAYQLLEKNKTRYAAAIPRTLRHVRGHFGSLSHGEGVLQAGNWLRAAQEKIRRGWPTALD